MTIFFQSPNEGGRNDLDAIALSRERGLIKRVSFTWINLANQAAFLLDLRRAFTIFSPFPIAREPNSPFRPFLELINSNLID